MRILALLFEFFRAGACVHQSCIHFEGLCGLVPVLSWREVKNSLRDARSKIWQRVYALVKRIPRGCVITYGELARMLRLPGGARAAGWAMGACPSGQGIPWQRVVGAGGRILLQEPRASLQRRLLEAEDTQFVGGRVDIARHHWRGTARKARSRRR